MKKTFLKKLQKTNVVIAAHIFATGPALELEEFLLGKVNSLLFIGHPFSYTKKQGSFFRFYTKGEKHREGESIGWKMPEMLLYFKEVIYTFLWCMQYKKEKTLFIGSDNVSAFLGLALKKIGVVSDVILYTIDYVPKRFGNPALNFLYRYFDKECLKHCKVVWNVSEKIADAREEFGQINRKDSVDQIVVPLGIWYERIPYLPSNKRKKHSFVFMGHLLEKQGLEVVIQALSKVIKKFPTATLTIIGTGPHESKLRDLVKKLHLQKSVTFTGYIESHEQVESLLAENLIAVATYKPDPESFTYFADPGKIKNYLAAGLPVLVTDVPSIAQKLEKEKCGIICMFDSTDVAAKMIYFLNNTKRIQQFSKNARQFSEQFDWNIVFTKALKSSHI